MAPSGAGKTTLLRILAGLEQADGGKIGGLEALRKSMVFQEPRLAEELTAAANIQLAVRHRMFGKEKMTSSSPPTCSWPISRTNDDVRWFAGSTHGEPHRVHARGGA